MKEVVWVAQVDTLRGLLSRQDPKQFLFFTRTANGKREGKAFLARLQERTIDRDTPTTVSSYFAQLKACRRWGKEEPRDLSLIRQPVLLANGDNDRMLPTPNTLDMARRLPNNELVIYPDAGHGGIFQFHERRLPGAGVGDGADPGRWWSGGFRVSGEDGPLGRLRATAGRRRFPVGEVELVRVLDVGPYVEGSRRLFERVRPAPRA
jgi:hypothetical protein